MILYNRVSFVHYFSYLSLSKSKGTPCASIYTDGVCLLQYFSPAAGKRASRRLRSICVGVCGANSIEFSKENVAPYSRAKLSSGFNSKSDSSKSKRDAQGVQKFILPSRRGFAGGEYTHTLRLTSELVDLRVEYVHPYSRA